MDNNRIFITVPVWDQSEEDEEETKQLYYVTVFRCYEWYSLQLQDVEDGHEW